MIPNDFDASLHTSERTLDSLDDGFSPPDLDDFAPDDVALADSHIESALNEQSMF